MKNITIGDIKRIILEELDSVSLDSEVENTQPDISTLTADSYNDAELLSIGEDIFNIAKSTQSHAESENASEEDIEFFKDMMKDAHEAAEKFPQTAAGMVSSIIAATHFFEKNINRFPKEARADIDKVIEFTNMGTRSSGIT